MGGGAIGVPVARFRRRHVLQIAPNNRLPTKRERSELLLLALASLLVRGGERIALLGGGRNPSSGRGALNTVLAGLDRDTPLAAADRAVPRHATLVLFGDFLDPIDEIARSLERVAAAGGAAQLVQVLDPAEMSLSFNGRVRFREMAADAPSDTDALIPRVEAIRPAYLEALSRQQAALTELARGRGWEFMVHGTDTPRKSRYARSIAALQPRAASKHR